MKSGIRRKQVRAHDIFQENPGLVLLSKNDTVVHEGQKWKVVDPCLGSKCLLEQQS